MFRYRVYNNKILNKKNKIWANKFKIVMKAKTWIIYFLRIENKKYIFSILLLLILNKVIYIILFAYFN